MLVYVCNALLILYISNFEIQCSGCQEKTNPSDFDFRWVCFLLLLQNLINHQFYAFGILKGVHILFLTLRVYHEPPLTQLARWSAGHDKRIEDTP